MKSSSFEQARQLVALLRQYGKRISVAESCTGGLLAAALTDVAGASEVLEYGFVTYSDRAKQDMLGVAAETLQEYTAVSPQTALEMAYGALQRSAADLAISVTGIAGPDGGSEEQPVGRVYMGMVWYDAEGVTQCRIEWRDFEGDRDQVREQAVALSLELASEFVIPTMAGRQMYDDLSGR